MKHLTPPSFGCKRICATKTGILNFALLALIVLSNYSKAQEKQSDKTHPNVISFEVQSTKNVSVAPMTTNFVEMGKPTGGYKCIVDMTVFNGNLFLSTADDPLGNWGAKVFSTSDALSYTQVLSDGTSQGYLRMGVFDNQLWIPDGDPNGYDPSYVYISPSGNAGSFTKTNVISAVHTFDVIKYNGKHYVSNGMLSGKGGMCLFNGSTQWTSVQEPSTSFRLKYMAELSGKLFVANANQNSDVDYYLWTGDVSTTMPQAMNKVTGSGSTYQIYASSQGKLFWTVVFSSAIHVLQSTDGINWTPSPSLDGKFVSDFAELNGKLYALEWKGGLWESSDHNTFTAIAAPPSNAPDAFGPLPVQGGYNADARASMAAYNGALYCGSSTNGKVYKVDVTTTSDNNAIQTSNSISLFPNPISENATVLLSVPVTNASMLIVNAVGQIVKSIHSLNGTSFSLDCKDLQNGMYQIQFFQDGNRIAAEKMILTK